MTSEYNPDVSYRHNDEAERAMLGAVFINNNAMDEIIPLVQRDGLFRESHRFVFAAMLGLHQRGEQIDTVTVSDELVSMGKYKDVGGNAFLERLLGEAYSAANVSTHAELVSRKHTVRQAINFGSQIEQWAKTLSHDDFMARLEMEFARLIEPTQQFNTRSFRELTVENVDRWSAIQQGQVQSDGLLSGIVSLDSILRGAHDGQLITIAARPAMGKSSLANNWATHIAMEQRSPVGIMSLEMSGREVNARALCAEAMVNSRKLNDGTATDSEWNKLVKQAGALSECDIYVDDTSNMSISQFRTLSRRWVLRHGVKAIFVDYLQLMSAPDARSREQEISTISRTLKNTARDLEIPVIALAQLSRKLEERKDKRPMLSDIRESGAIEQDSDVIIFCYRDHVYNPESDPGDAELIVAKNRRGPTGVAHASWLAEYTRFVSSTLF